MPGARTLAETNAGANLTAQVAVLENGDSVLLIPDVANITLDRSPPSLLLGV
jgi:hypothetical protein